MKVRFPWGVKQQEFKETPNFSSQASNDQLTTGPEASQPDFSPDIWSGSQNGKTPGLLQRTLVLPKVRHKENEQESGQLDAVPSGEMSVSSPASQPEHGGKRGMLRRALGLLRLHMPTPDWKWNQKTVTISLEKDVIRMVTFKGKRVTAWNTTDISQIHHSDSGEESSIIEGGAVSRLESTLDEMGIKHSGKLWKVLNKVGIRRGRVVMDLSLYSTLMRHLEIPKVRMRYLEPVVVSEVLESLPFSKDEVDISWQLQKGEEGLSVYAVALPKKRVDTQVELVKEAGLIPAAAYSKASALALAAGVSDGVLVHVETSEIALVLVNTGEPKVVHQLELASAGTSPEEHGSALVRAIEQVAGYHQPSDPNQKSSSLPVVLTGQTSGANPSIQAALKRLRRPVLSINPPLRYSEDFPIHEYATNLGLFLTDRMGNNMEPAKSLKTYPPLNLLPRRHQPAAVPVFPAAVFVILILLAVHPFNITTRVEAKVQERNTISRELSTLQRQESSRDVALAGYQKNSAGLEAASDEISRLETRLEQLDKDVVTLLARLSTITDTAVPETVSLSGVAPLGLDFSLVGTASSHAETLRYAANLKESPLFADARVIRVDGTGGANPDSETTVGFQIKVTVPVSDDSDEASAK